MRIEKSFKTLRSVGTPIPVEKRFEYSVKDLKEGSFLFIVGQPFVVQGVFTYKDSDGEWFELELYSIMTGKTVYIEYEEDDTIEICITTRELKVRDLPVSVDDIEEMTEEEEGEIHLAGKTFYYEDDYKAKFFRKSGDKGEKLYVYEFETDAGDEYLTIEEWGNKNDGYEYKVYLSKPLDASSIEIVSL